MQRKCKNEKREVMFAKRDLLCALCLLISFFVGANSAAHIDAYEKKLLRADEIRSSHREEFNRLVKELVTEQSYLKEKQKVYLSYLLGYQQLIAGNLDVGINLLNKVIEDGRFEELKYRAIITKINAHTTSKNYAEGFIVLNNLLPKLKSLDNSRTYQEALIVVSIFYSRLGQYDLSRQYATQLLNSEPSGKFECIGLLLDIESSYFLGLLSVKDIDPNWTAACELVNEPIASNNIRLVAARIYLDNQQPKRALDLLQANLTEAKETGYYLLIDQFYTYIAQAYYDSGEHATAEEFALKVIDNIGALHSSYAIVFASELLYKISKERGDFGKALDYHEQHLHFSHEYRDDLKSTQRHRC
mgnify:CR=1 FL=1